MLYLLSLSPIVGMLIAYYANPPGEEKLKQLGTGTAALTLFLFLSTLVSGCIGYSSMVTDTEVWGGWVTKAEYYEEWNEYIHQTCTRTVSCGKDCTTTETYDCSYVRYHAPQYWVYTSNGESISISKESWEILDAKFGNTHFHDMHRHYHSIDGDMYQAVWMGDEPAYTKIFTTHTYVNKVQNNSGVFHFENVDPKGLYAYPESDLWNNRAVLGIYNGSADADSILQKYNSKRGAAKQVKLYLLLFNGGIEQALDQRAFWKGGNKNEFVLCVGIKDRKVSWVQHFCWSPEGYAGNDEIGIEMRSWVGKDVNLPSLSTELTTLVDSKWRRKSFKEFEYLDVDMPTGVYVTVIVLSSLAFVSILCFGLFGEDNEYVGRSARSFR